MFSGRWGCTIPQKEVITFSIGYTGEDIQEQKVKVFLNNFKSELESIR
jgi:hypothetical protein